MLHKRCAGAVNIRCICHSFQSVPLQTPVRGRAVCAGWEADAQTQQERQVGGGGGRDAAE